MISRIKKFWNGLCDILEGPGEYSAPDFGDSVADCSHGGPWEDWPLRWALVRGGKFSHIGYIWRQESIHREPGFSDTLDIF